MREAIEGILKAQGKWRIVAEGTRFQSGDPGLIARSRSLVRRCRSEVQTKGSVLI